MEQAEKVTTRDIHKLFNSEDEFILCCHVQPDGDGLGSALALSRYLMGLGKKVSLTMGEEKIIPPQYRFLPGTELFGDPPKEPRNCVFVALDCANFDRVGALKDVAKASKMIVNIDHHPDNTDFGEINMVDPGASSVSEMIYKILRNGGDDLDCDLALCLYVGLVTDTGRFQYNNTSAESLRIAADLIECGVNPNAVFQNVYENNSFAWLKIIGRGMERAVFHPELSFIYAVVTAQDFEETGATLGESENLVDWLRGLEGVKAAAVFKETKDKKVKVSLRSKGDFNVSAIANSFNGGGHKNAAGYVSDKELTEVIDSLLTVIFESQRPV